MIAKTLKKSEKNINVRFNFSNDNVGMHMPAIGKSKSGICLPIVLRVWGWSCDHIAEKREKRENINSGIKPFFNSKNLLLMAKNRQQKNHIPKAKLLKKYPKGMLISKSKLAT